MFIAIILTLLIFIKMACIKSSRIIFGGNINLHIIHINVFTQLVIKNIKVIFGILMVVFQQLLVFQKYIQELNHLVKVVYIKINY